jgi:hypothetical protein
LLNPQALGVGLDIFGAEAIRGVWADGYHNVT